MFHNLVTVLQKMEYIVLLIGIGIQYYIVLVQSTLLQEGDFKLV